MGKNIFIWMVLVICGRSAYGQSSVSLLEKLKADTTTVPANSNYVLFNPRFITADHYKKQLGFFCLKELQVEKALKFPLKFRLGALEYCNYLEGKNGLIR